MPINHSPFNHFFPCHALTSLAPVSGSTASTHGEHAMAFIGITPLLNLYLQFDDLTPRAEEIWLGEARFLHFWQAALTLFNPSLLF